MNYSEISNDYRNSLRYIYRGWSICYLESYEEDRDIRDLDREYRIRDNSGSDGYK